MTKAKSKRKPASRENNSKTKTRNSVKRTTPHCYKAGGSSTAAVRVAANCTPRKQNGSHHCNVASARWRDH